MYGAFPPFLTALSPYIEPVCLRNLVLLVVVDLVVPEKCLVPISEEEVLGSDVLVWVFDTLLKWRKVFPMLPMFAPEIVGIDRGDDETGDNNIDGKSSPKATSGSSVCLDGQPLPVECVVRRTG